jgi:hypothetical protein
VKEKYEKKTLLAYLPGWRAATKLYRMLLYTSIKGLHIYLFQQTFFLLYIISKKILKNIYTHGKFTKSKKKRNFANLPPGLRACYKQKAYLKKMALLLYIISEKISKIYMWSLFVDKVTNHRNRQNSPKKIKVPILVAVG